jgi:hypothetical protein
MGGFFNYTVEMSSGAMIHVPSFIKFGSGIQKLIWGYADRQQGNLTAYFYFFKVRKVG